MEIYKTQPTISSDELVNVIKLTVDGRALYQCSTCSKQWEGEKIYDHVEQEAQKRILEKAIERLEGKKHSLESWQNFVLPDINRVIDVAIAELKSLLGEV